MRITALLTMVLLLFSLSCSRSTNTKRRTPDRVVAALELVRGQDVVMSAQISDDEKTINIVCGFDSFAAKDTWFPSLRDEVKKKYDLKLEIEAVK